MACGCCGQKYKRVPVVLTSSNTVNVSKPAIRGIIKKGTVQISTTAAPATPTTEEKK